MGADGEEIHAVWKGGDIDGVVSKGTREEGLTEEVGDEVGGGGCFVIRDFGIYGITEFGITKRRLVVGLG